MEALGIEFEPTILNHSQSGASIELASLILENSMERMGFEEYEDFSFRLPVLVHEINMTPWESLAGFTPDEVNFGIELRRETPSIAEEANRQLDKEMWKALHDAVGQLNTNLPHSF